MKRSEQHIPGVVLKIGLERSSQRQRAVYACCSSWIFRSGFLVSDFSIVVLVIALLLGLAQVHFGQHTQLPSAKVFDNVNI